MPYGSHRVAVDFVVGRYYDPQTGQFLSVDAKVQQTLEAYLYVGGDPVNEIDPNGMAGSGFLGQCAVASTCPNVRKLFAERFGDNNKKSRVTHPVSTYREELQWARNNVLSCDPAYNGYQDCSPRAITQARGFYGCAVSSAGGGCFDQWVSVGQHTPVQQHQTADDSWGIPIVSALDSCTEGGAAGASVGAVAGGVPAVPGAVAGCLIGVASDVALHVALPYIVGHH
jgi:hypothetical protein